MSLKTWLRFFQSTKLPGAGVLRGKLAAEFSSQTITTRSGSAKGSGRKRTASTVEKIAVLAPMPRASAPTATEVNPGAWRSSLRPYRRSLQRVAIDHEYWSIGIRLRRFSVHCRIRLQGIFGRIYSDVALYIRLKHSDEVF
jgi:hypothetical protein